MRSHFRRALRDPKRQMDSSADYCISATALCNAVLESKASAPAEACAAFARVHRNLEALVHVCPLQPETTSEACALGEMVLDSDAHIFSGMTCALCLQIVHAWL